MCVPRVSSNQSTIARMSVYNISGALTAVVQYVRAISAPLTSHNIPQDWGTRVWEEKICHRLVVRCEIMLGLVFCRCSAEAANVTAKKSEILIWRKRQGGCRPRRSRCVAVASTTQEPGDKKELSSVYKRTLCNFSQRKRVHLFSPTEARRSSSVAQEQKPSVNR